MTEDLDLCAICKTGYLKPTGEVVVEGESAAEFRDIGTRRIFVCDNCGQRQVRVGHKQYVKVGYSVKTKIKTEPEK